MSNVCAPSPRLVRHAVAAVLALSLVVQLTGCGTRKNPVAPQAQEGRQAQPTAIGSDPRLAVRNECWYAIDQRWISYPGDAGGPAGITAYGKPGLSNWNYLSQSADGNANALRWVLADKGGYVSNVIPGVGGTLSAADQNKYALQLSSADYGLNGAGLTGTGPNYRGVGHGAQCVSFAEMIIYRARNGLRFSWPAWSTLYGTRGNYASATTAIPGDLVFYVAYSSTTASYHGHVGVCVVNDGAGIWVVDSNYLLGDGDKNSSEVIGRHYVSNASISAGGWKRFSGSGRWY